MKAGEAPRNRTFLELRADSVLKDDGRYLIYYSWPDDPQGQPEEAKVDDSVPPQEPWSPETAPTDV